MKRSWRSNYKRLFIKNPRLYLLAKAIIPDSRSYDRVSSSVWNSADLCRNRRLHSATPSAPKRLATKTVLAALLLVGMGCGEDETTVCPSDPTPIGVWQSQELDILEDVLSAFTQLGLSIPGYNIRLLYTQQECREYALPQVPIEIDPDGWAKGACLRHSCTVLIRRWGNAGPHLKSLLVHELLHAIGYEHGDQMREKEKEIWNLLPASC